MQFCKVALQLNTHDDAVVSVQRVSLINWRYKSLSFLLLADSSSGRLGAIQCNCFSLRGGKMSCGDLFKLFTINSYSLLQHMTAPAGAALLHLPHLLYLSELFNGVHLTPRGRGIRCEVTAKATAAQCKAARL